MSTVLYKKEKLCNNLGRLLYSDFVQLKLSKIVERKEEFMGVKMSKARFDGRIVSLEEYRESMKGQLRCIYCGTPITHVSGYTKNVGDREVWVKSYFRLLNKENPHNEGCEYITSNVVKKIFAKVSDTDLMTKKGDKYITRLHIVMEEVVEKDKRNGIKGME